MNKIHITIKEVNEMAEQVAELIDDAIPTGTINVYGVPRGGLVPAFAVHQYLRTVYGRTCNIVDDPKHALVFIDDLIDSGATQTRYNIEHPGALFFALFTKGNKLFSDGSWLVFPWEVTEAGETSGDDIAVRLLQYIGEDPTRGGLAETPKRFLKAWKFWSKGYEQNPKDILKVFKDGAEKCDEMVIVRDIPVYSHCEHHLAPFFGTAHVGYIPDGSIVGLSKLSRLVDIFAQRLQVQERLTNQVVDALMEELKPLGAAVVIECRHLCMESRGIQRQGSSTITSAMRGVFKEDPKARSEFMSFIKP